MKLLISLNRLGQLEKITGLKNIHINEFSFGLNILGRVDAQLFDQ